MPARSPLTRIGASLASVVMIGSFAVACGDDDDSASTTTAAETSSEESAAPTVSDPWVRPAEDLAGSDRSAIYMEIQGGDEADALVAASVPSDITDTVEIHETIMADGDDMSGDGMEPGMSGDDMAGDDMGSDTTMAGDDMAGDDMAGDDMSWR